MVNRRFENFERMNLCIKGRRTDETENQEVPIILIAAGQINRSI
jgi:hypothetical protein